MSESELDSDTKRNPGRGPWRRIVRAWASDPQIRFEGSTGGVLTALAAYLLSSRRVKFILHAKASTTHPTFGERHLSFTEADVLAGAGSRYGPTAPLIDVREVLDRGEPFAFVGKPCVIAALRNYASLTAPQRDAGGAALVQGDALKALDLQGTLVTDAALALSAHVGERIDVRRCALVEGALVSAYAHNGADGAGTAAGVVVACVLFFAHFGADQDAIDAMCSPHRSH